MIKYAQRLQETLIAEGRDFWDAEEALTRLGSRGFRLSQKDHWENNGILEDLMTWSQGADHSSLLWIGGKSGSQDSWVTELSLDIVEALLPQQLTILYVFCSDMLELSNDPTPRDLVRNLISQFLDLHPELAFTNTVYYNERRFRKAKTFSSIWQIFENLLMSVPNVFIIIDRVEECAVDDDADLTNHFLPSLASLLRRAPESRAIVTSIFEPPEELSDNSNGRTLDSAYIDTQRPDFRS
jgi:hypothetical protein